MIPSFEIEEYKIIEASRRAEFSAEVTSMIREGWILWGSPYNSGSATSPYHTQAMIKRKNENQRYNPRTGAIDGTQHPFEQ